MLSEKLDFVEVTNKKVKILNALQIIEKFKSKMPNIHKAKEYIGKIKIPQSENISLEDLEAMDAFRFLDQKDECFEKLDQLIW